MVNSVSTDRGRRQKLQSKSHIHVPAPISVLPCQIPELGTLPSRFRLQSKEKKDRERIFPLIFRCRCLACKSTGPGGKQISLVKLFFFLSLPNGRVKNSV